MTQEKLAAIEAALALSTGEGEWIAFYGRILASRGEKKPIAVATGLLNYDATFIALAHNVMPALLTHIDSLTAVLAAAHYELTTLDGLIAFDSENFDPKLAININTCEVLAKIDEVTNG